jgi:hypothetical protein
MNVTIRRNISRIALVLSSIMVASVGGACQVQSMPSDVVASGDPSTAGYDWPQFNFDAQHSGNNTRETQISVDSVHNLVVCQDSFSL